MNGETFDSEANGESPGHAEDDEIAHDIDNKNDETEDNRTENGDETETVDDIFTLHCLYIDFDGKVFGPVLKRFSIAPFGDLKPIKSLPIYPLRFATGLEARQKLIERGKMLLEVAEHKAMYYMGPTIDKRDEIDSQVVIDFSEALADEDRRGAWEPTIRPANTATDDREEEICRAPCCYSQDVREGLHVDSMMTTDYIKTLVPENSLREPSLILSPRSLEDIRNSTTPLTDTELLLMTYRVFGFVLRSRKWAQLDMTFLRYENSNARHVTIDAFRRLELPTGHREMVQSLVTQHFRNKQTTTLREDHTDLVQGKGKGLIMLLHGAPGVGKTTTAEGVSELFRKPLFQITCGDLGTTAREVEAELEKSFALASRWGCILLLDEADVFLSTRERNDFTRNGLVAVFLRVLEYYTGILFLTTNRIGDLDEAFASRIHMSLHYPELDEQKTLKVFELHLDLIKDRFKRQGRLVTFDPSSINNFASRHFHEQPYNRWNGRQIRNACQTALALAEFDAQDGSLEIDLEIDKSIPVALDLKYFLTVQRAYIDFSKYLADIQGTQGDRRAYDLNLRAITNTPFAAKQSRFDSISEERKRGQPQPHETRYSTSQIFGSQTESFHGDSGYQQSYRPAAQMHNPSHSVPHVHVQEASSGFRGYENVPAYGTPGSSQHAQMESRLSPGRQQDLPYEIPQSNIPATYSGDTHMRPVVSSEGSPVPYRVAQHSVPHYGYNAGSLGGHQAGFHASGFADASPRVQEGLADPATAGYPTTPGGPMRIPQQGNSMPQA
ncbi:ATPase family AAA domain-containing protein 3B [Colletotrichum siamense]|nr:ATPase family AAA domain-containing protein 3B [Colletotrichum siamense]